MTQLTPTELMAVEVPMDSHSFSIDNSFASMHLRWLDAEDMRHILANQLGLEKAHILGTVTEDEISFDVEKYVESIIVRVDMSVRPSGYLDLPCYKNYGSENQYKDSFLDKNQSFKSLLTSNGLDLGKKYLIVEPKK